MITSKDNERIKELRKLQDKKHRDATGLFAAEGEDLVAAALDAGWAPKAVFHTPAADTSALEVDPRLLQEVSAIVLADASALGSGSRVIGVFEQAWSEAGDADVTVYLDGVGDPGNLGTVLRSALAFADGPVVLGPGCADPYSPKAVRASMGALFARPPARAALAELRGAKLALDSAAPLSLREAELGAPVVICVGGEREGLGAEVLAAVDVAAAIPIRPGGPESLNAAIAASIALYEVTGRLQPAVHAPAGAAMAHENPAEGEK